MLTTRLLRASGGVLPPANTASPTISGAAAVGNTLSCTQGTWTGSPTAYAYQWQYGSTDISGATSSTYVIAATYQGSTLRCKVTATNAGGSTVTFTANTAAVSPPTGQVAYTAPTTYSWTVPAGVASVSMVGVGGGGIGGRSGGGGGGGGGLTYRNNISVTTGEVLTVVVGAAGFVDGNGSWQNGTDSSVNRGGAVLCSAKAGKSSSSSAGGAGGLGTGVGSASFSGGAGGSGGNGNTGGGGGGAGGYAGAGGAGGYANSSYLSGSAGTGGSGGGGGGNQLDSNGGGGGGGGVGLLGQGAAGAGGYTSGGGGSGGGSGGGGSTSGGSGGLYGGGSGGGGGGFNGSASGGAVRIIWPGTTRQFPSTNTGDM